MKLSGELDYRIRYDVEHDLFHAQNVFNDEYITPTFIEYVQKLEKETAELKEFYEKEYFEIADRTADEKIKELEKYQTEVTVDDYSPYDENTWGMMHEEMFVPKELVRDLLKESYALSEHRKEKLTKAKEIIKKLYSHVFQGMDFMELNDYNVQKAEAEQFLKEVEK